MNDEGDQIYRAPALEKGLDIIELLARERMVIKMPEIATRLGRSKSEIFRMLQVLETRGYIRRGAGGEGYEITNKLFSLSMEHPPILDVVSAALPQMRELAAQTGLSCHLAVVNDDRIVVIARVEGPGDLGFMVRVGYNCPIAHSTSGKAIFAFQPESTKRRWLELIREAEPGWDSTDFENQCAQVREKGFVRQTSEAFSAITDLSAPILSRDRKVALASLTILWVERRPAGIGVDDALTYLCDTARSITETMHSQHPV